MLRQGMGSRHRETLAPLKTCVLVQLTCQLQQLMVALCHHKTPMWVATLQAIQATLPRCAVSHNVHQKRPHC